MPYKDNKRRLEKVKEWKSEHPSEVKVQKSKYRKKHYQEIKERYRAKHPIKELRGNGRCMSTGYIIVRLQAGDTFFSPMANKWRWVSEHRLTMAKHLGRCLLPWEVVHHRNGERDDNRLENLELLSDKRWHMVDLQAKNYIKRLEATVKKLEGQLQLKGEL